MSGSGKDNVVQSVIASLAAAELQASIVSVECVPSLFGELESRVRDGAILPELLVEGYLYGLAVTPPELPRWARSLIVVSMAQPIVRLRFEHDRGGIWAIVPPNYRENRDIAAGETLRTILDPLGIRVSKAWIPLKLAAARSGLAEYGRNNITYTRENGSFHRLAAFFSDLPCENYSWGEPRLMDSCSDCEACRKNCPTGCIRADRFVIGAERCLTFHNETATPLPDWIDPSWMNSLVGCMRCQAICPVNRPFLGRVETWGTFSREETEALLAASNPEEIPFHIADQFREWGLGGYLEVLGRNLEMLINR